MSVSHQREAAIFDAARPTGDVLTSRFRLGHMLMEAAKDYFRLKSRLGGALVSGAVTDPALDAETREPKLSEAESLLLEGGERLCNSNADRKGKDEALQWLVRRYKAWNKPDKCTEWQQKLDLFDKAQGKSSASEPLIQGASETKAETK